MTWIIFCWVSKSKLIILLCVQHVLFYAVLFVCLFVHFMFSIVCLKSCTTLKLDMNPKTSKLITYIIWPHFVHAFTSEFVKPHNLKCIFPVFETPKISSHLVCSNAQRQCPCWKFVFSLKVSKCPKMPCKETRADHFRTLVKCFFHSIFQNHFSCFLFNLCTL